MRRAFAGMLVMVAGWFGAVPAHAEDVPPPRSLGCLELTEIRPAHTARDLAGAVRVCVDDGRHGDAFALFIAYNSVAVFDQQRVRDTSAHLVLHDLNMWVFTGYSRNQITSLKGNAAAFRDTSSAFHRDVCAALVALPPPRYRPSYMIAAGQMPRKDAADWQVKGFDPAVAWQTSVLEVNGCGGA